MGSFGEVTEFGHGFRAHFLHDPKYTNLNHGMSYYIIKLARWLGEFLDAKLDEAVADPLVNRDVRCHNGHWDK